MHLIALETPPHAVDEDKMGEGEPARCRLLVVDLTGDRFWLSGRDMCRKQRQRRERREGYCSCKSWRAGLSLIYGI